MGNDDETYWECSGPADGSPLCISSQRAELYGILSALRFLYHGTRYQFRTNRNLSPVTIICDNKSAIKYATPPHGNYSAIYANHPDYDIAAEIHATIKLLPMMVEFDWVKGHQDNNKAFHLLSREAQLNVLSDRIATEFAQNTPTGGESRAYTHLFPHTVAQLSIGGNSITSNHKRLIRNASLLPPLKLYIIERGGWEAAAWDLVDWNAHGKALNQLPIFKRHTISKFTFKWLPTNHNMAKRSPLQNKCCPLCQHDDETDDHMCQCKHEGAQNIANEQLQELRNILQKYSTDPTLRTLLVQGVYGWIFQNDKTLDVDPPHDHPYYDQLRQAILDQNAVGWDQILRGRLATSWGTCYTSWNAEFATTHTGKQLPAVQWLTKIAVWGHSTVLKLWDHRNEVAFAATNDAHTALHHQRLQEKVRDLYSQSQTLPRSDQDAYFLQDRDEFQLNPPGILTVWINQVERIFIKHRKEVNQRLKRGLITHYFRMIAN